MALDPSKFNIEEWLELEEKNILQKFCNIFDDDGLLVGQYKTRVFIVPQGQPYIYGSSRGKLSSSAPALYRSFNYDEEGNQIASVPVIAEWTQACEDAANGGILDPVDDIGVPPTLKVAYSTPIKTSFNVDPGLTGCSSVITVPAGEEWFLRFAHVTSCNRALWDLEIVDSVETCNFLNRTTWTRFNETFDFSTANGGKLLVEGDTLKMCATNYGTIASSFDVTYIVVKREVNV